MLNSLRVSRFTQVYRELMVFWITEVLSDLKKALLPLRNLRTAKRATKPTSP